MRFGPMALPGQSVVSQNARVSGSRASPFTDQTECGDPAESMPAGVAQVELEVYYDAACAAS